MMRFYRRASGLWRDEVALAASLSEVARGLPSTARFPSGRRQLWQCEVNIPLTRGLAFHLARWFDGGAASHRWRFC